MRNSLLRLEIVFLVLVFTSSSMVGLAQNFSDRYRGSWAGFISVNSLELELIFHIDDDCSLDVPAQGAKGIKAAFVESADGSVRIDIVSLRAYYEGSLTDGRLVGNFYQNGMKFPLILIQGKGKVVNRPQTPVPPFAYCTEEVRFANGGAVLSGTLTMPQNGNLNTPVVLMITGSGGQNRDEEMFEHKPFAVIADAFAKANIATLRYDDRGVAQSTGDIHLATTDTLAADAAAGIFFLRQRGYKRVGALGHSEGGTIAFMLAADGLVDFIVSMAGSIEKGEKTLLAQLEAQSRAKGADEEQAKLFAQQGVAHFKASGTPWMNRFLELNPADYIRRVDCSVFAINGEKDIQVLSSRNIPLLQTLLPTAQTKVYPDLNHLFQHCNSVLDGYYTIEETISQEVLDDMICWISCKSAE